MNAEAWDADGLLPPAVIPDALSQASFTPPGPLTRGNEPTEVVILIDVDVFSGAG